MHRYHVANALWSVRENAVFSTQPVPRLTWQMEAELLLLATKTSHWGVIQEAELNSPISAIELISLLHAESDCLSFKFCTQMRLPHQSEVPLVNMNSAHPPLTSLSTCSAPRSPARPSLNLRCGNLYRVSGMCRLNVPYARIACLQASTKQQSGAFLEGCVESKAIHALPRGLGNQLQVLTSVSIFCS